MEVTFELLLQRGHGGYHGGVDVVQPRAQSLLVVERLERLESGVVAARCFCECVRSGKGGVLKLIIEVHALEKCGNATLEHIS